MYRRAFSLVELLVVMAVLGILASLLLPVLSRTQLKARQVQCLGNLRQIGTGLQLILASDHAYPLFLENTNGSWIDQVAVEGLGMNQPLTNYIRTGVWHCPSAIWIKPDTNVLPLCYGYNFGGLVRSESADTNFGLGGRPTTHTPVQDSEVRSPVDMIAFGDVLVQRFGLTREPTYLRSSAAHQRHQGRLNITFSDGHVEPVSLPALHADTNDTALARWNRDHQPHREALPPD